MEKMYMTDTTLPITDYITLDELQRDLASLSEAETSILNEINRRVAASESLERLIDFVFEETRSIFPCDRISVAFLEDNYRRVVTRAARASYSPLKLVRPYSEGIAGSSLEQILSQNQIRIINDLERYASSKRTTLGTQILIEEGVRSSLTCPLRVEGRAIGFLFRNSRQPYAYSRHEVLLHSLMAERLSQAMEKAWRLDQLAAANNNYLEMLSFASHELKGPLASIAMECDMLLQGYMGDLAVEQQVSMKGMIRKIQNLIDTTDEFLSLAKLEGTDQFTQIVAEVDLLADVIRPAASMLSGLIEEKGVRLQLPTGPDIPTIACDPSTMRIAFSNLLHNALKYGQEHGEIRITLDLTPDFIICKVWNSGRGFPPEEKQNLFRRFSRLDIPEFKQIRGTGVGLYTVWRIIDAHEGRISADSLYGEWAEFTCEIPRNLRAETQ